MVQQALDYDDINVVVVDWVGGIQNNALNISSERIGYSLGTKFTKIMFLFAWLT